MSKLKIQNRNLANEHSRDRNKAEAALAAARKELNEDISKINGRIEDLQAALEGISKWQTEHEAKLATLGTSARPTPTKSSNATTTNRNRSPKTTLMTRATIPTVRRPNTDVRQLWRMWEDIDEEVQRELDACHTLLISRSQALATGDPGLISEVIECLFRLCFAKM